MQAHGSRFRSAGSRRLRPAPVSTVESSPTRWSIRSQLPSASSRMRLSSRSVSAREARQLIFVDQAGRVHHLPIREGTMPEQLRAEREKLSVENPFDVHLICGIEKQEWVEHLITETWPSVTVGDRGLTSTTYNGAVTTVTLTDRYFRAVAKIGFHCFLTQVREYTGAEANSRRHES